MVLRITVGKKRQEVTGGWRKLHTFHSPPDIIRILKSRKKEQAWNMSRP
jgi:hypothetical protein